MSSTRIHFLSDATMASLENMGDLSHSHLPTLCLTLAHKEPFHRVTYQRSWNNKGRDFGRLDATFSFFSTLRITIYT